MMNFAGLSHGKKVIGAVAVVLAMVMCLSMFGSALAAPTPTPTFTPTPSLTPKPGGNNQPDGPGGGGSSGGSGTKPGDGPSGTGRPEATAPPKKETPPDEDNIPIEVEVDPDLDADLKPKKGKKKEYEKTAVWAISFKRAEAVSPNKFHPEMFIGHYTLDFVATKTDVRGGKYGTYKGDGYLRLKWDTAGAKAMSEGNIWQWDTVYEGALGDIDFTLVIPMADAVGEDELAPLEEKLAPLVPPGQNGPLFDAQTGSKMIWSQRVSEGHIEGTGGMVDVNPAMPDEELTYSIYAYPSGKVELYFSGYSASTLLKFWGTISKRISWKQVK